MSIIGVRGIPPKLSLEQFIRKLAHVLHGQFEAFSVNHKTRSKTFYLKLSHRLETRSTIALINRTRFPFQMQAFLPENDMNLQIPQKTKKIPNTLRKALNIPLNFTPKEVLTITHEQILIEMLSKFNKLYELSCSTYHFLLKTLYQNLHEKLEKIQSEQQFPTCYSLSKCYRDEYPHKSDIQLIKDIYKNYQLEMGLPEMELNENEFYDYKVECDGEDCISLNKAKNLSQKYSNKIINKIMDHIKNYDFDQNKHPSTTIEVRQHIKKLSPLIPNIVKSIIKEKFDNQGKETFSVVRIYGEPFLPNKKMKPFLKKYSFKSVERSERIHNLITVKIPTSNLNKLLKADGTDIMGSHITVRPLNTKQHIATLNAIKIMINQEKNVHTDQMVVQEAENQK